MFPKTTTRAVVRLAVLALLGAGPARAQEPPPRSITLDEALKAADLLPDIKAAEAALRAAEAGVKAAGRLQEATFSFATRSITAKESYGFSMPLPWPGRGARIDVAKAGVLLAGTDRESARLIARRALRLAWFTLAAREDMESAAKDRASRAKAASDAVAALFDAGRVALVEASRSRADAAIAAADESQADEEQRIAESVLRRLLTLEPAQRITVARPLPTFAVEADLEAATARGLVYSPAAKAAEAKIKAAEASARLASSLRYPGLVFELGADANDPTQPGTDRSIGASVTIPFGAGPGRAVARGELDRAIALREQAKREIADAVELAWRTAHAARVRYETLERDALPAATQAADLAQVAYREGRSDIFRVLDAERALSETRTGLAEAYLAWGTAYADLMNAMGEEQP